MSSDDVKAVLEAVADGRLDVGEAERLIRDRGIQDLGFARLDTDRERRTGMAEVIFAPGKTDEQLEAIIASCIESHGKVLATRVAAHRGERLEQRFEGLRYHRIGRVLEARPAAEPREPEVAVVSAGTSDLPVAEEAALVLEHLGHGVNRVHDVGVAGIHRLFSVLDAIRIVRALVVVAGMEGALPSVVAGLVEAPVVAVPTSVGYGASFGGVAALLGMLNTCASGIGVVNIDNGFGAATLVHRMVRRSAEGEGS